MERCSLACVHVSSIAIHSIRGPTESLPGMSLNLVRFLASTFDVDCVSLYLDVAQGLEYLHSEDIIHGDPEKSHLRKEPASQLWCSHFNAFGINCCDVHDNPPDKKDALIELCMIWCKVVPAIRHFGNSTEFHARCSRGNYPFHDFENDFQSMVAVKQGKWPLYLSRDLCRSRGLTNNI